MQWRRLGYPVALAAFGLGFLPAASCVHELEPAVGRAATLRLHGPPAAPGPRGQVRVVGRARGESRKAVDGRLCLAESWDVTRVTGSGKNRSVQAICHDGRHHDFTIEGDDGTQVQIAAGVRLRPEIHDDREAQMTVDSRQLCDGRAYSSDRLETYCLRHGEEVEAWGCLAPGTSSLVACHDDPLGDLIEGPPRGGALARLRDDTRQQLAVVQLAAGGGTLLALALLSTMLVRVRRSPAGGSS